MYTQSQLPRVSASQVKPLQVQGDAVGVVGTEFTGG